MTREELDRILYRRWWVWQYNQPVGGCLATMDVWEFMGLTRYEYDTYASDHRESLLYRLSMQVLLDREQS